MPEADTLPQLPPESTNLLSQKALHGTFWNYISFVSGKLLNFATTIILAHLLIPEQFGLVGYCTLAIQYLDIMNTAGIDNALIARKEKVEGAANAAFIINIIMGVLSFCLAWFMAPLLADFFHEQQVVGLFRLLAVVLPISGLGLVPDTLIQRSILFRTRLIPVFFRSLIKGLVSIILALLGWGPWSLVWGQIAGEGVGTILSWILAKWRPTWKFDWQATKELIRYGSHIFVIGIAGALLQNVDYMIVGRALGAAALGYYTMAYRIPELAIRSLNGVVAGVLFPVLSQAKTDVETLRSFYLNYIRYISIFTFSIGTGLSLVAGLFINNFMSDKWTSSIFPLALISIALAIGSVGYAPGVIYKAVSRPEILTRLSLIKLPIIITLLIFCSRWNINGMAVGQVILAVLTVALDSFVISRIVHFKLIEYMNALVPAVISSGIMAVVISSIQLVYEPVGWGGFGLVVLAGVISFVLGLALVSKETANVIYTTLRKGAVHP